MGGCRPQHQTHVVRQQFPGPVPEFLPLGFAADLPGQAHPAAVGFQHHIPAGQGNVPGHRRTLAAPGILHHLDQEHLAFGQGFPFLQGQESILAGVQIYKGRLDPGHHIAHPGPVHIAHQIVGTVPLHGIVPELIILHGSHPGFFRTDTDKDRIHGQPLSLPRSAGLSGRLHPGCTGPPGGCPPGRRPGAPGNPRPAPGGIPKPSCCRWA